MSLTAQTCFDRAVRRSSLNSSSLFPIDDALGYMSYYQAEAFNIAGQVNPDYFGVDGTTGTRSAYTDSWNLASNPGSVGIISKVEIAAITGTVTGRSVGEELNIVDFRFPEQALTPRIYIRNNKVYGYSTELGAADANMITQLKLYYSFVPSSFTTSTDTLALGDEWAHLVITPMAAILALSDQRVEDYDRLKAEHAEDLQRWIAHLQTHSYAYIKPMFSQPINYIANVGGPE